MEIVFNNVTYKENVRTPLEKTYLKNVNFTLIGNKVYTFLGDSKSGKDKIPLLINAVSKPYIGTIKIDEFINNGKYIKNINKLRMNIGIVPSNPERMLFNNTVKSELSFGLKYFKYKLNKQEIRVKEALKLVNLGEEYLNKKIKDLRMSEKKKIAIASSLIFNPNIIILDEPTLFLNHKEEQDLIRLINMLKNKYKKMIIILTKNTDFAYQVSDVNYIINDGKIIEMGDKTLLENKTILNNNNLNVPKIVDFVNVCNKKGANLTYTNNILDLIKEVYRNAK